MTPKQRAAKACPKLHGAESTCHVCNNFVDAIRAALEEAAKVVESHDRMYPVDVHYLKCVAKDIRAMMEGKG